MAAPERTKTARAPAGLLAKPTRTLDGHTSDVVVAFRALFGEPGSPRPLTPAWLRFFKIGNDRAGCFLLNGLVAAASHDWGKANDGFQNMLVRRGEQVLRHERLSGLFLTLPGVERWLGSNPGIDLPVVLGAVAGHHLKAARPGTGSPAEYGRIRTYWREMSEQLRAFGTLAGLSGPVPSDVPKVWSSTPEAGEEDLAKRLRGLRDRLQEVEDDLDADEPRRHLLWAVRSALIAADSAGSGLFRTGHDVGSWIERAFDPAGALTGGSIMGKVIEPRLEDIGPDWRGWNPFQEACGDADAVPARAVLLAPCGSGKTLAAWRWVEARCAERPVGRAIFLYPTRGTATEGYRDYAAHAGPDEAALVHGTADLDLEGVHDDVTDERRINEGRLYALAQWPKRVFSATVDQFLGFLQHGYSSTCLLPLLADSVVVVDEVHCYDRGMFSALEQFLKAFDIPVLAMTATLLERRRDKLSALGMKVVPGLTLDGREGELTQIADYKRYRLRAVAGEAEAGEAVRSALGAGKRVLWVVNTVDRAQAIAGGFARDRKSAELKTEAGVTVHCYHSRYRLGDRVGIHKAVVDAFKADRGTGRAVLAVATQVCEMSLDLDADLLVTEYAPASSLVQRLGRCCRDMRAHANARLGDVILYRPESESPYSKNDMHGVDAFVTRLTAAAAVSQSDLESMLGDIDGGGELPRECRFIEGGPWARQGEENFRDSEDPNRQALLAHDVEEYLKRLAEPKSWRAKELILSVPKKAVDQGPPDPGLAARCKWLHVADAKRHVYLPALGYCEGRSEPRIA